MFINLPQQVGDFFIGILVLVVPIGHEEVHDSMVGAVVGVTGSNCTKYSYFGISFSSCTGVNVFIGGTSGDDMLKDAWKKESRLIRGHA